MVVTSSTKVMTINVVSSRASPLLSYRAEIILKLSDCLMFLGITVGL